ncbi:phosphotransferase [Vibrio sp. VPAP30]|uniref:phosphotransferase n=1 Tax=Vibrio sp. VPAP30 TaxID=1647102 RepID=UPI000658EB2F|nr:phosphotransferase [Vibrio sp. VPAP30]KLN63803.1 hypothetical protein ZX61_16825 [Vibrio sp. VPAP30]
MQPEDQPLIGRESEILGLHIMLDESKMLALMRQYMQDVDIFALTKVYIRYKPETNCLVKYLIESGSGSTTCYVKAYTAKDSAKLESIKTAQNANQIIPIIVKKHLMIIYPFPLDAKLKVLPRLLSPESLPNLLARALYPKAQVQPHIQSSEILQYKPERRLVLKLQLTSGEVLVAKAYTDQRYKLANLSRRRKLHSQHLLDVVGRSSKHKLLVFRWIEGRNLTHWYHINQNDLAPFYECGQYLRCFHQKSKPKRVIHKNTANFLRSLQSRTEDLAHLMPKLKSRLTHLTSQLLERLQDLKADKTVIHGDFYASQVLVTPNGNRLIDFDDVCYWYSAYDIGTFIAHLEFDSLGGDVSFARSQSYRRALLQGYGELKKNHSYEIELFTALALLQLAHQPFRDAHPQWAASIYHLIERCEQHLQSFKLLSEVNNLEGRLTFSSELFDLPYARQLLLRSIKDLSSADRLICIAVTRYKANKRVMIEYTLERANGERISILGKVRIKGFDKRTWHANKALYNAQFGPNGNDGIQVPKPLGCSSDHHIWFQSKVAGKSCFDLFCQQKSHSLSQRIAQALHKLHFNHIETDRHHSNQDEIRLLEEYLTLAANQLPTKAPVIQNILHNCKTLADELCTATQPTLIHRDFYHDQILVADSEVYLLDLDLLCYGSPALDVGNFVAHIEEQCLREFGQVNYAQQQTSKFVEHYLELSGLNLNRDIEIYTLLSWARHIYISQRIAQRNDWTEQIIELCEQRITRLRYRYL